MSDRHPAYWKSIALLFGVLNFTESMAQRFILPPADTDLIGDIRSVKAQNEDTLLDIARRFDIGQEEILLANPDVDRWIPGGNQSVTLPMRYILPDVDRTGIVLNVAEMRLYYYPAVSKERASEVQSYPVSIGRMDWSTPLGMTKVSAKTTNPSWRPPESIRAEALAQGEPLPEVIPPGPDNPLGNFAMRLAIPGYLIHSTNKPYGVGMRVTHGCIRMYPEDIASLYPQIPVGTPVRIVNQAIKLGWLVDTLFIEIHPPLEEYANKVDAKNAAMDLVNAKWRQRPFKLDVQALNQAIDKRSGMPVAIAKITNTP
jgi:L,D-transpeptidase ErfK/SrfK